MELKDYQIKVIESLEGFLQSLKKQKADKQDYYEFQISKRKEATHPEKSDYCNLAWQEIKAKIAVHSPIYSSRLDGMARHIPNICFKVPTGGGKTLLASCAVQRINQDYFNRNNGFVLWVVPSETIYIQTSHQLRDREHPYRQMLDKASGGKTLILDKNDRFTWQDVQDNVCVMLLMLQSSNRDNKETLRIFRDSGKFESFFPEIDDYIANDKFLRSTPNLEVAGLDSSETDVIQGISIKHSLGNVLRLCRPIVIIDEGHRATTQLALNTLNNLNPSFILELSATPKSNSNVLINVGGTELKKEQMIKLPINVASYGEEGNWRQTLNHAHKKLAELQKHSVHIQQSEGKYIRPIMVIKAEAKKKNDAYDHVEDVKKYLINHLGVIESEIRIKLAEKDEIKDEDLLDKLCPVKYIITKDALKEGWDCPFAYVLTILTNTRGQTALTQFIGRVLRQPYATQTSVKALNQCFVYCNKSEIGEAVEGIKKGLEDEGLGDIQDQINVGQQADIEGTEKVILKRNEKFQEKILIPQLNVIDGQHPRKFDYYQDILAEINWESYQFDRTDTLNILTNSSTESIMTTLDINNTNRQFEWILSNKTKNSETVQAEIDIALMASQLMEKIPNPWQAAVIVSKAITELRQKKFDDSIIAFNSVYIVDEIKKDCLAWLLEKSEALFRKKLDEGKIFIKLLAEPFLQLNWQMLDEIIVNKKINEPSISWEKNIFQPQYNSLYNGLEKKVAFAINKNEAVKWWHRLGVKGTEYYVQGWKRDRIYPDFLVKLDANSTGITKIQFIETKGDHLDNPDSQYKQKVFDYINQFAEKEIKSVGEMQFINSSEKLAFNMVFENNWEHELRKIMN